MITIESLNESSFSIEKEIIPPQLDPFWARILDSDTRTCYTLYIDEKCCVQEQLNFCIIKCSFGKVLISMPYVGYGSCFDVKNSKYLIDIFSDLDDFASENDCLAMSVCTHPLSTVPFETYKKYFKEGYFFKNFCQISICYEHPLSQLNHHRRMAFNNEISKMTSKSEYYIDMNPEKDIFDQWFEIYKGRFQDLNSPSLPYWFYYNYFKESQTNDKINFWVIRNESSVVGGVFITVGKNIADYGTSAFNTEYRHLYPTTFLLNKYFEKMITQHIHYFNWQSSPAKNGGVYNFKKRWGAKEYEHYYLSKHFVDLDEITSIPSYKIKNELTGCYLLPFTLWGESTKKGDYVSG